MTDYQPDTPRAALAVGAMVLTGVTLAALVAAPMAFDSRNDAPALLAAALGGRDAAPVAADTRHAAVIRVASAVADGPTHVAIVPARLDVIGTRGPVTAQDAGQGMAVDGGIEEAVFHAPNVAWAMPNGSGPCRPHG